jgi:catechol 2,3-dioxygenase-like lactoylglutathione lyase family enzyme
MADDQSILSHVSFGTNNFERAAAFYDAVLAALGCRRIMEHEDTIAWGKSYPEFWVHTPLDGQAASVGNGTHICFSAATKEEVHGFYEAALAAGAADEGPPGPRPQYGPPYYGCFVRDLDGHKIEATWWDLAKARELGMM